MGGFTFNPVLSEIQSHMAAMSPAAQAAVKMANPSLPDPTTTAKPQLQPGMLLPHSDAGPPADIQMPSSPLISMPKPVPTLVTGPKRGQAVMSDGTLAPLGSPMGDQAERSRLLSEGSGISQISDKIQHSRLGQAHPLLGKILGGLAQGAGTIGDIALSTVAPEIAINTPGTEYHHQALVNHADRALNEDVANQQKESQTALENATAGHTAAETPEVAPNAASVRALQGAEAAHAGAETENLTHPPEEWKALTGVLGPNGQPVEVESRSGQIRFGNVSGLQQAKQPKPDTPEQQYIDEYQQTHKGATVAEAERAYTEDTQRPPQQLIFVPQSGGGFKAQVAAPGTVIAPGAQTAAGVNAVDTPTTQQRTAAGRAQTVVAMAPEVLGRIDALTPKLGPIEGRWNEFMQGKVGADDPDFAALRSDLLMMSSAVALAHAQGRLPENLREEFDRALNAPKQTPANLKATINAMLPWLQQMQSQGQPNARPNPTAKPDDPLGIR